MRMYEEYEIQEEMGEQKIHRRQGCMEMEMQMEA